MTIFTSLKSNWTTRLDATRDAILEAREQRRAAAEAKLAAKRAKSLAALRYKMAVEEMLYKVQRDVAAEAAGDIVLKERVTIIDGVSVVHWE